MSDLDCEAPLLAEEDEDAPTLLFLALVVGEVCSMIG
jgi:hypothetical protein